MPPEVALKVTPVVVVAACLALTASTPLVRVHAPLDEARPPVTLAPNGPEPPATVVQTGDPAPDVTWEGPDSRMQRLRDLRAQGHVLLVFAPTRSQLLALERDRDRLLALRVLPAAVLDLRATGAAGMARRLGLHYTIIPDPQRVIAAQFNALDPSTHHSAPAWFVVDRWGRVRALDRSGVPESGYTGLVSSALALPAPGAALPSRTR